MKTDHGGAETLHLQGLAYRRAGKVRLAIEAFQKAIAIGGDRAEFHKDLGNVYADAKKWDLAQTCFQTALRLSPAYVDAWYDMGCAMQAGGFVENAVNCYRQVLELDPAHAGSLNNMGVILEATGQIDEALACYQRAVQGDATHYIANTNLGDIFKQKGDPKRALACYERAISINPGIADAYQNKGFALWDMGQNAASVESFAHAHRLAPDSDSILINYANALLAQGRPRRALSSYRQILDRHPKKKQAILNMGLCHEQMGNLSSAMACYRHALKVDRNYSKAQSLLVSLLKRTCSWDELKSASKTLDRFTQEALANGEKPAETPFLNISRHIKSQLNDDVARAWAKEFEGRHRPVSSASVQSTGARIQSAAQLTIGYLSCNFRNHPTAQLMAGLIGQHDRGRFIIVCYSYGIDDASHYREDIKKKCDHFVDLRGMGDGDAATRIRSDGVNILVDLGGFTKDSRLGIAARRPAELQARYLGLAGTTGASFFDYLVTDKIVTPPRQARYYSEQFLYMPDCYQVNNYQENSTEGKLQRSDCGLPCDGHVYSAFHAAYKIDYQTFMTWMRILKRVEKSVLWLCIPDALTRRQLVDYAHRGGVPANRLVFADNLLKEKHLKRLRLADIALDTTRVTGAATTSDALWANLPVITLKGQHFASRMSTSILSAAGLPQLVTTSLNAYEDLAVLLAKDPVLLKRIRKELHNTRNRSPLFNTKRFARHLENGYEMIWTRYRMGHRPSMMEIPAME